MHTTACTPLHQIVGSGEYGNYLYIVIHGSVSIVNRTRPDQVFMADDPDNGMEELHEVTLASCTSFTPQIKCSNIFTRANIEWAPFAQKRRRQP